MTHFNEIEKLLQRIGKSRKKKNRLLIKIFSQQQYACMVHMHWMSMI